jgi:hypothetical protein
LFVLKSCNVAVIFSGTLVSPRKVAGLRVILGPVSSVATDCPCDHIHSVRGTTGKLFAQVGLIDFDV